MRGRQLRVASGRVPYSSPGICRVVWWLPQYTGANTMGRTLARDRAGWTKAVTLHCPGCNKRIGLLDEQIPGMVDDGLGTIEWMRLTNKAGEEIN